MSETIIRISDDGKIVVETSVDGIISFKQIAPDSLLECINKSLLRGGVSSGLLPKGCLSFTTHDNGDKNIFILHPENRADITYYGSSYPNFPLPKLVFGFYITKENRISQCRLGVVANESHLKPTTPMFVYPFSNVSGANLCIGNNVLPKCQSLHTLGSGSYYILSIENNNDSFKSTNNKQGFEMRDLLELLRDKPPEYYYSDVLILSKTSLGEFITEGSW
jgi:hypothetical protein